jgi:hypothetical protein
LQFVIPFNRADMRQAGFARNLPLPQPPIQH